MRIAIIGTGNVGRALGQSFVRAGHDVVYAARDAAKTADVAGQVGATSAPSVADAARSADIVVLAVPYLAADAVVSELGGAASGKVVIDVTNPLKADYSGLATEGGPSGAERIATLLGDARVVKAFNTLFASVQGNPSALGNTVDALFATDDEEAHRIVADLVRTMGFRPVAVGSLAHARELEAMAWLNISLQMAAGGDWRSAFVLVGAPVKATAGATA